MTLCHGCPWFLFSDIADNALSRSARAARDAILKDNPSNRERRRCSKKNSCKKSCKPACLSARYHLAGHMHCSTSSPKSSYPTRSHAREYQPTYGPSFRVTPRKQDREIDFQVGAQNNTRGYRACIYVQHALDITGPPWSCSPKNNCVVRSRSLRTSVEEFAQHLHPSLVLTQPSVFGVRPEYFWSRNGRRRIWRTVARQSAL